MYWKEFDRKDKIRNKEKKMQEERPKPQQPQPPKPPQIPPPKPNPPIGRLIKEGESPSRKK